MPKTVWPNATYYSIMKIPDKRDIQQIALNHSSDIEFSNISTKKNEKVDFWDSNNSTTN